MNEQHNNGLDDEIFFGDLTLYEVKKHIGIDSHRQTISCVKGSPVTVQDESLQIIEIHSTPNVNFDPIENSSILSSPSMTKSVSSPSVSTNRSQYNNSWDKISDESFLRMENMVSETTSDIITYNNEDNLLGSHKTPSNFNGTNNVLQENNILIASKKKLFCIDDVQDGTTPKKTLEHPITVTIESPEYSTPVKRTPKLLKSNVIATPQSISKLQTPVFKTPGNPLSIKKPSSSSTLKKTPNKPLAYQHITSPVASYIKNSYIVPLVKEVRPRKPLPGPSSIPKIVKTTVHKPTNKENYLPQVGYKSAKSTKVIKLPEESKLPQSQWVKKMTSSLPKPYVMRHVHREMDFCNKKGTAQEDSFEDLSLHQAEVSVCTQSSAFKQK